MFTHREARWVREIPQADGKAPGFRPDNFGTPRALQLACMPKHCKPKHFWMAER
jgi:hypothetical protein